VIRADGSGRRRLTSDGISFHPVWSPDGERIY
jgi:Tol biopolymer transport system component